MADTENPAASTADAPAADGTRREGALAGVSTRPLLTRWAAQCWGWAGSPGGFGFKKRTKVGNARKRPADSEGDGAADNDGTPAGRRAERITSCLDTDRGLTSPKRRLAFAAIETVVVRKERKAAAGPLAAAVRRRALPGHAPGFVVLTGACAARQQRGASLQTTVGRKEGHFQAEVTYASTMSAVRLPPARLLPALPTPPRLALIAVPLASLVPPPFPVARRQRARRTRTPRRRWTLTRSATATRRRCTRSSCGSRASWRPRASWTTRSTAARPGTPSL